MARSREEHEPPSYAIRQALNDYYEGVDEDPPVPARSGYDGEGEDAVFVALDSAVSAIAAHISALSIDTLLQNDPSEYDYPIYIIGLQRAWIFDSAFHVQPVRVDAPRRTRGASIVKSPEQDSFVQGLVKQKLDEIIDQSGNA